MYGHDAARTGTSSCPTAPSPGTVGGLLPRWALHTADVVTATPTIVDGVAYVGDWSGRFYALDVKTGTQRWAATLGLHRSGKDADRHHGAYGVITSSAAVTDVGGRRVVLVGAGDSLYALDNGRVLWRTDLDPRHPTNSGEIESSPVVWSGAPGGPVVFVGSDANQDSGYTGEGMWALSVATGKPIWHFNPETATHHGLYGCGNVWSSPALGLDAGNPDPARRAVLYFGTADCPNNSGSTCPTDGSDPYCPRGTSYNYAKRWSPYSEAIIAVSAVTGRALWSYQGHTPLNQDDDDFGAPAQLFALPDGRRVVGEGNKDGTYTVLDQATGRLIWNHPEVGNGNVQPGLAIGGFLGATAVMPVGGVPRVFGGSAIDTPISYNPATAGFSVQPFGTLMRNLTPVAAFSGVDGAARWSVPQLYTYAPTTAANGVVYIGALDGIMRAYAAATGRLLWAFPVAAPISSGAAITDGAIVVGVGTSETDLQFKLCDRVPASARTLCRSTPLNTTINPLSNLAGVWGFSLG